MYEQLTRRISKLQRRRSALRIAVATRISPAKVGQQFLLNGKRYAVLEIHPAGSTYGRDSSWNPGFFLAVTKVRKDGEHFHRGGHFVFDDDELRGIKVL